MKKKPKPTTFQSGPGKFGVWQGGAIIYEADFNLEQAKRLAELESLPNPPDWLEAKEILRKEGLI